MKQQRQIEMDSDYERMLVDGNRTWDDLYGRRKFVFYDDSYGHVQNARQSYFWRRTCYPKTAKSIALMEADASGHYPPEKMAQHVVDCFVYAEVNLNGTPKSLHDLWYRCHGFFCLKATKRQIFYGLMHLRDLGVIKMVWSPEKQEYLWGKD